MTGTAQRRVLRVPSAACSNVGRLELEDEAPGMHMRCRFDGQHLAQAATRLRRIGPHLSKFEVDLGPAPLRRQTDHSRSLFSGFEIDGRYSRMGVPVLACLQRR